MWVSGGAITESGGLAAEVSAYLLIEPPILREACQALQHDDEGRGCASCCVRKFCDSQARRAGRLTEGGC